MLSLIFLPGSTSDLHKSTQTIISNQEYKAVTDSLMLKMILSVLKLHCRYNNHANLVHQHFKTLNVIICCIKPEKKGNYMHVISHYTSNTSTIYTSSTVIMMSTNRHLPQVSNRCCCVQHCQQSPSIVKKPNVVFFIKDLQLVHTEKTTFLPLVTEHFQYECIICLR